MPAGGILRAVLTVEETEHISAAPSLGGVGPVRVIALVALVLAFALSGCGGGPRQDKDAASGTWKVTVLGWKFAKTQPLGKPQDFVLRVRNDDTRTIPDLIVTIRGIKTFVQQPGAASTIRPIWLTQDVNYANTTPYNSPLAQSFNMGPLEAGQTSTYSVTLTPLRRGEHRVGYTLAPALFGDNKIVNAADDTPAADTRMIAIDPTPVFDEKLFKD